MTKDEALDKALEGAANYIDALGGDSRKYRQALANAALDKKAENARELGLDYEPAEVLGHNGWGFPIKAAAPVQKKCDCAAHSAADCVCGAWDKSAVAPVREDWGPGPHEYHSLTAALVQEPVIDHSCKDTYELIMKWADIYAAQTGNLYAQAAQDPSKVARMADERTMLACVVAQVISQPSAPVQEPVAWRYRGILHDFDPSDWAEGPVTPLYTTPPAAQRQWVGLTDEEIGDALSVWELTNEWPTFAYAVRAIEAKLREKNI